MNRPTAKSLPTRLDHFQPLERYGYSIDIQEQDPMQVARQRFDGLLDDSNITEIDDLTISFPIEPQQKIHAVRYYMGEPEKFMDAEVIEDLIEQFYNDPLLDDEKEAIGIFSKNELSRQDVMYPMGEYTITELAPRSLKVYFRTL